MGMLTDEMSERNEDTCGGGAVEIHGMTISTAHWLSRLKMWFISTFPEQRDILKMPALD